MPVKILFGQVHFRIKECQIFFFFFFVIFFVEISVPNTFCGVQSKSILFATASFMGR